MQVEHEAGVTIVGEFEEDFAFEPFHVLESDVEEIAGAAGGIEDFDQAELAVKFANLLLRLFDFAFTGMGERGGADAGPLGAERLDDGGKDEAPT
jgi:hypothetical protein